MFKIFFQVFLIIYIIFLIFNILDLKKFNQNGLIVECIDSTDIKRNLMYLNPIIINYKNNYHYDKILINKGDRLENIDLHNSETINIKKDKNLLNIFNKNDIPKLIESNIYLLEYDYISIYKDNITELKQTFSNHSIIYNIDGLCKLYLFNPKHKDDIKGKNLDNIKKWAHIREIKKGDLLIIPTNWYYIIKTNNFVVLYNNYINNIFTFIPNYIKENYLSYKEYLKI
jgi:hypothetical protein